MLEQRTPLTGRADRILDAAGELLLRFGYRKVTIEDIARQTGIGKGTVYLHWRTKDQLFQALILRESSLLLEELTGRLRADPTEVVPHRFLRTSFLATLRRPLITALFTGDTELLGKLQDGPLRSREVLANERFYALMTRHRLLRDDIPHLAYAMAAATTGFYLVDRFDPELVATIGREARADALAHTVRHAFEPAAAPAPAAVAAVAAELAAVFEDLIVSYRRWIYAHESAPGADRRRAGHRGNRQGEHTMTILADDWGIHTQQFWLRGKRPDQPVEFDPALGMWNVYGHPEAWQILSDPATFSSDTTRLVPDVDVPVEGSLVQMDPPEHRKLRKLVSHAFTPKVVADLEPRIAGLTTELLDAVAGRDRMELVADLAYPLPVIVIAELLGVPSSDRHLFKQWVDKMLANSQQFSLVDRSEEQERALADALDQNKHLTDYLGEHAAERRSRPREDLLTKLVEAEVDGQRLSQTEVVNFANILLLAGHITTTMLLGNTLLCLDTHPEQFARVRADRSTLPAVIEESLRYLSPFATLGRATNTEAEVGGTRIPADQLLMVWVAAANRDPRQFRDPDTFDPGRDPNPHLAFGRGIHFCLGAPLARLEGRIALNILLDRYPELHTDPDRRPDFIPSPNMTGVRSLPLVLHP